MKRVRQLELRLDIRNLIGVTLSDGLGGEEESRTVGDATHCEEWRGGMCIDMEE